MKKKYFRKSGFTLIELLVVMIIIGILATIITYSYQYMLRRVQLQADVQSARVMTNAVLLYEVDKNKDIELADNGNALDFLADAGYVDINDKSQTGGTFVYVKADKMVKIQLSSTDGGRFTDLVKSLNENEKPYVKP